MALAKRGLARRLADMLLAIGSPEYRQDFQNATLRFAHRLWVDLGRSDTVAEAIAVQLGVDPREVEP